MTVTVSLPHPLTTNAKDNNKHNNLFFMMTTSEFKAGTLQSYKKLSDKSTKTV